jgi:hypothetical protein
MMFVPHRKQTYWTPRPIRGFIYGTVFNIQFFLELTCCECANWCCVVVGTTIFFVRNDALIGYRSLVGKLEGKRPLGRPRRRWIDNIKMDPLEIGLSVVEWIGLAQDRYRWRALVNSVMNLRVP